MFNLENAILDWRKRMLKSGIKQPVPLDELESHLRDEIDQQLHYEKDTRRAFDVSVERLGASKNLKNEFQKNQSKPMKKALLIGLGIVGILVGMAFVMPAVAQYKHEGAFSLQEKLLLPLGIILTGAGIAGAIAAFKKRHA